MYHREYNSQLVETYRIQYRQKCKTGKSPTPEGVGDFPVLHFLPVFDIISHFYQLFLVSCLLDSYVLLADDHVNNGSYFPFMSIKKVFCVLREGYYVIIWLIIRICVFIKDWKLIYSELFILKRKSMVNWGAVDINCTACICR